MAIHSFDTNIAVKYGVQSAVLLNNIYFWIEKNKANGQNYYDGYYWTYNSKKAFAELFPYMNARQVDYALKKLIDDEIIITGNYNQVGYDRTLWYAITKKGYCILQNCKMEETKMLNATDKNVEAIPYSKPNNKPNNKTQINDKAKNRFTPPTVEEVKQYCIERKNKVDAERFVDYYTSNGWKVGKNNMKDWKATVRTWERNDNQYSNKAGKTYGANGIEIQTNVEEDNDPIWREMWGE